MAPTKISATAETIVATVTVKGASEPGEMPTPRTSRVFSHVCPSSRPGQAAASATAVRYGVKSTVAVVVT